MGHEAEDAETIVGGDDHDACFANHSPSKRGSEASRANSREDDSTGRRSSADFAVVQTSDRGNPRHLLSRGRAVPHGPCMQRVPHSSAFRTPAPGGADWAPSSAARHRRCRERNALKTLTEASVHDSSIVPHRLVTLSARRPQKRQHAGTTKAPTRAEAEKPSSILPLCDTARSPGRRRALIYPCRLRSRPRPGLRR